MKSIQIISSVPIVDVNLMKIHPSLILMVNHIVRKIIKDYIVEFVKVVMKSLKMILCLLWKCVGIQNALNVM